MYSLRAPLDSGFAHSSRGEALRIRDRQRHVVLGEATEDLVRQHLAESRTRRDAPPIVAADGDDARSETVESGQAVGRGGR